MTSRDPQRCCEAVRSAILYLVQFVHMLVVFLHGCLGCFVVFVLNYAWFRMYCTSQVDRLETSGTLNPTQINIKNMLFLVFDN